MVSDRQLRKKTKNKRTFDNLNRITDMDVEKLEENIGKKCRKRPLNDKNIGKYKLKPFKSGNKVNTIKGVISHPNLEGRMAYTFEEDESYVECRRCEVIVKKVEIKTKEEISQLMPIIPQGFWWRTYISNLLYFSIMSIPVYLVLLAALITVFNQVVSIFSFITIVFVLLIAMAMIDNLGPVFTDRYFKIHYYKKKKKVWEKWWYETSRYIQYLEYKKEHEKR